ncbi:hypothetical protein P168DRAFT_278318 [Aspergillus campestris IBT 28561]|uniref:Cyclin-domain-containing protein n=1 Tax=Aspergillus campestris (strain IBT 28561) TaxID=1392248 RepID=A0A2I1DFV3_ASPC2|nr:uncharacterized protein P168DRAFT_278318 [Aspergillus campestris IBT 28561]PKY08759.1 hypothetical protein P168DRAFT_278318 [Aspergillus campestris IBT 28561]
MSLPVLPTHSFPTVPPITPTPPVYTRAEGVRKRHLESLPEVSDHWTAPFRDGLPTPPSDMTGVAYNSIPPSSYGSKLEGITLPPYAKAPNYSWIPSEPSSAVTLSNHRNHEPSIQNAPASEPESRKKSTNSVPSYLKVPPSINNGKGSLTEFAAQMTCLFWFESTAKLKAIEDRLNSVPFLVPEAFPTAGFQKWVTNILSTTQVSQNVILLALMFVYRLKKFNPGVRGKKGSEYRLMTIALMLGNKFLDDNTYTNKTWAEVSGISVQEIHIMEVEFLSNVRYNLFASEEQWAEWHTKLALFADFFNKATPALESEMGPSPPVLRVSPNLGPLPRVPQLSSPVSKLPSPPASDSLRSHNWNLPLNGPAYSAAPQPRNEGPVLSRKRTRDEQIEEHPAKRVAMPNSAQKPLPVLPPSSALANMPALPSVLTPTSASSQPSLPTTISRLPPPNFPPPSSYAYTPSIPTPVSQYPPAASRAMQSSFNPAPTWPSQMTQSMSVPPMTNGLYASNTSISLPDPGRLNSSPFGVSSATVSPASAYSVHTPQTYPSPSYLLANRNSPYRPVRSVNTLLIPPPSSSLQQQRNIPYEHMHYQPLGKTAADRKSGLLPYLQPEDWSQGQQFLHPIFHSTPNY